MKENLKIKIKKRFKDINFKKIILYNNPNEYTSLYIERVNPDHIGIIWGKRHKKFNKGTHYVKCGKVFFSWLPMIVGVSVVAWFDAITNYVYNLLLTIGLSTFIISIITSALLYYLPFKLYMRNTNGVFK
ncbi:MAG: hypothetical protein ACFFDN_02585 [Candidatus Hodarchaeota archaeon]